METRRRTWFDDRGLVVGDRAVPFYAGAMHYWRVPPAQWPVCLRAIRAMGLTLVETYVPWRVHEPTAGASAWSGQHDLGRFLVAAGAAGLGVVLRPGPHVNAELTSFGMPDHVLAEPAVQARTARGTPVWMPTPPRAWPVPSYASTAFHAHVARWYAAVAKIVAPHLAPDGPVVAIGVDNEAQMFFRLGAFDFDYHPDALAWFGKPAPRDATDPAAAVAWVAWKSRYLARALGLFATMLDDVGLDGIARYHNLPPGHFGLSDARAIQEAIGGPVGIDAYTPRSEFSALRHRALACVGTASPLPLAPEVGVGFFPWFPPLDGATLDPLRERDQLLTLLGAGIRGFELFMAVDRDRYYGAAIDQQGKPRAPWIAKLLAALVAIDWPALRRHTAIALVDTRADARFGDATNVLDPVTPVVLEALGIAAAELGTDAGAIAARRWQTAIIRALELAQVPFAIVDEGTPEDVLATYRAVIAPTVDRIDRGLWSRLRALADARRCVVVIGPGTPTRDEFDAPLADPPPRRLGKIREGSLDDLVGLAADLAGLAGELEDVWQVERPDTARAAAFADADGTVRAVFVYSDADKATVATLFADGTAVRDPLSAERFPIAAGRAQIPLPSRGIRMLLVE